MLNRAVAPEFSKIFSIDLPAPDVVRLPGEVDFVHFSGLQQEAFKLEVIVRAGKWHEPKPGLAHFTALMLDKGTSTKSSKEIAEILDYYGAQLEISPGYDFVSISLYGLKKFLAEIFPVFFEILSDPVFSEDELELQKKIFLQNLEVNEKKTSFLASRLIRKNIFGAAHPYGNAVEKEHVDVISKNDLRNYFTSDFSPGEIYLIGDIEARQVHWLVDQLPKLGLKKKNGEKKFEIAAGPHRQHVTQPESIQSSIRMGMRTINRQHQDYFSLLLLNHLLGGYFGSRLMKNIREEKGLTYGIYSSLNPFQRDCLFSIGADVDKTNVELTVSEIQKEIESLIVHPVGDEELDIAKSHLLGSIQLEMANPFSTLDKIKSIRLNQLGHEYYRSLFDAIKSATPAALQATAQTYFNTGDFHQVAVG